MMTLETAEEGMAAVKHQDLDIVIPDYKLPGMDGLEFLKKVKKRNPAAVEILITAYGSYDLYKEAENMGIQDFIPKPFTSVYIEMSMTRVIQKTE